MIDREQITGLVLAGGRGSRMGRLAPQVGHVMINANRNLAAYESFGVPVWPDALPDFAGPLAGFLAGLERCETPYLATLPCDSPLFPVDLVARLAAALEAVHALHDRGPREHARPRDALVLRAHRERERPADALPRGVDRLRAPDPPRPRRERPDRVVRVVPDRRDHPHTRDVQRHSHALALPHEASRPPHHSRVPRESMLRKGAAPCDLALVTPCDATA